MRINILQRLFLIKPLHRKVEKLIERKKEITKKIQIKINHWAIKGDFKSYLIANEIDFYNKRLKNDDFVNSQIANETINQINNLYDKIQKNRGVK